MRVARMLKRATLAVLSLPLTMLLAHCGTDDPITGGTASSGSTSSGAGGSGDSGSSGSGSGKGGSSTSTSGTGGADGGVDGGANTNSLDPTLAWYGDNRQRLQAMIEEHGKNSAGYDKANKPVALFDWDNTVIKNDIGDATVFWMLLNDKILQPKSKNWAFTSPYLTPAALTALYAACGSLAAEGTALPTSTSTACTDEIFDVYYNGVTTTAMPAWSGFNYRTIEPAYAWAAQLQAGYTPTQIGDFADKVISDNLAAFVSAQQAVGSTSGLPAYIRVYDQMKDLIAVLQTNGFDVWVVSASPQDVVERFAKHVNVAADHVIGIRAMLDPKTGNLTSNLQGCGSVPDGINDGAGNFTGDSLITYIDGKRCWINKIIYGDVTANAMNKTVDPKKRQVFSAGDSNTDITFVQDATVMKLVLNRNKPELMCNAYRDYGGKWLINPMFIKPKSQQLAPYPCSTTGCVDQKGKTGPCYDENGGMILDQADNVY